MSRPRDIVANHTVIEVTSGKYAGMRGYVLTIHEIGLCRVMLVGRDEPIYVDVALSELRPADTQTIGTGES